MSQAPVVPSSAVSVEADIPCRKCSYNLRGLPLNGRCPECATPVSLSVKGDLLRYSDPRFIQTLSRGTSFILWGVVAVIILAVFVGILGAKASQPEATLFPLMGFLCAWPSVIGGWLLTTPDPSGIDEDRHGAARKVIRISLTIGMFHDLLNFTATMAAPIDPNLFLCLVILQFMVSACTIIGLVAQLGYLKKLAMRIPDPVLSSRAIGLMWTLGIAYGAVIAVAFILQLLNPAGGRIGGGSPLNAVGCVGGIGVVVVFVLSIKYITMLMHFGRCFREQASIADAHWSKARSEDGTAPTPTTQE